MGESRKARQFDWIKAYLWYFDFKVPLKSQKEWEAALGDSLDEYVVMACPFRTVPFSDQFVGKT